VPTQAILSSPPKPEQDVPEHAASRGAMHLSHHMAATEQSRREDRAADFTSEARRQHTLDSSIDSASQPVLAAATPAELPSVANEAPQAGHLEPSTALVQRPLSSTHSKTPVVAHVEPEALVPPLSIVRPNGVGGLVEAPWQPLHGADLKDRLESVVQQVKRALHETPMGQRRNDSPKGQRRSDDVVRLVSFGSGNASVGEHAAPASPP
jgi:hypothetical protein